MGTSRPYHLLGAVVGVLFLATGATQAAESTAIQFACPGAVRRPAREAGSGPGIEDSRMPELILAVRRLGKETGMHQSVCDYEVKRVLFGSYASDKIRLYDDSSYWYQYPASAWSPDDEYLVAIAPSLYDERPEYTVLYHFPLSQERAEMALCQARLDYAALSATCIFVGKEVSLGWADEGRGGAAGRRHTWPSTVEVQRVITGQSLTPGARIRVSDAGATRFENLHPRAHPQARIYLVSLDGSGDGKPVYRVITHQPLNQEAMVREALKHGGECPTVELKEHGGVRTVREILFRGDTAEAIELLDAQHAGVLLLMNRTLMHRRKTSRADVIATIEKSMFRLQPADDERGDLFLRQERLIDLLAEMQGEDGGNDVERLTEKLVAHMEQLARDTTGKSREKTQPKEKSPDVGNDTLLWLLRMQNQEQCFVKYSDRLLLLRERTTGPWRSSVEAALKHLNVDDILTLKDVTSRMKGVRPLRLQTRLHGQPGLFFPKPSCLRTVDIERRRNGRRVSDWDLTTKTMLRQFTIPEGTKFAGVREPDGGVAIGCDDRSSGAGGTPRSNTMQAFDLETGKLIATLAVPPCDNILWLNDHEAFAIFRTSTYGKDERLYHFDYRTGAVRQHTIPWGNRAGFLGDWVLDESGRLVALPGPDDRGRIHANTAVFDLATNKLETHEADRWAMFPVYKSCLVPGGKYFCLFYQKFFIVDRRTFKVIANVAPSQVRVFSHALSRDGRHLALLTGPERERTENAVVRIHDVQTGKTLVALPVQDSWAKIKFAPDGRRLAVAYANGDIELWPLPDLTAMRPGGSRGK